jgi:hypothetical protein
MPVGYLVLTSERRVLSVVFDGDAIHQTIGSSTIAHGTTFHTEDELIINIGEIDDWMAFKVQGVPFPFRGNPLLVGTNPDNGGTADYPRMSLYEFRRLITFVTKVGV